MDFSTIIIIIIVVLVLFFLLRELNCWYWKINKRIELTENQNKLLENILLQLTYKSDSSKSRNESDLNYSSVKAYDEWKKENPSKSLTDYFSSTKGKESNSENEDYKSKLEDKTIVSTDKSFEDWKKENPTKSMTDYYAALMKKGEELKEKRNKTNP